jgi:hypothetical protein
LWSWRGIFPFRGCQDHLLDIPQPVLAEENLVTDKKARRAEGAALD